MIKTQRALFLRSLWVSRGGRRNLLQRRSPSAIVDSVWHLHLTYTADYWGKFCKETLQRELHHYPSSGGNAESKKHDDWYRQTLVLYGKTFKEELPEDIWPPLKPVSEPILPIAVPDRYFNGSAKYSWLLLSLPFLLPLFFTGGINPFGQAGSDFLLFYLALAIAALAVTGIQLQQRAKLLVTLVAENLSVNVEYELLVLQGMNAGISDSLIGELQKEGVLRPCTNPPGSFVIDKGKAATMQLYGLGPLLALHYGSTISIVNALKLTEAVVSSIETKYEDMQRAYDSKGRYMVLPASIIILGAARVVQGICNDKPVGYLVALMVIYTLVCYMMIEATTLANTCRAFSRTNNVNAAGDEQIAQSVLLTGIIGMWIVRNSYFTIGRIQNTHYYWRNSYTSSDSGWGTDSNYSDSSDGGTDSGGSGCGGCSSE